MGLLLILAAVILWWLSSKGSNQTNLSPQGSTPDYAPNGLDNITEAMARFEGFYQPGSVAQRTNNPGNIGTFGGNVASYSDVGDGWTALNNYVRTKATSHPDWTLAQFITYYLTGDPNGTAGPNQNPTAYADYVANYVGVDPNTPVSQVLGG